ncbi:SpoIID/LytB domain protein [Clostridiales bacterium oral taxon 876 str. F0540]|nr:SpoIID/LytB domain protein [Clostridiales bacterium oral taxon 876 str. F0540]
MKKIVVALITFLIIILGILFFPRSVEQGIVTSHNGDSITMLVNGKVKVYKTSENFPKLTVVDFKYNLLKAFNFKVITPITDRVMVKNTGNYDLESLGTTNLSSKTYYYIVDKDNNIKPSESKSLIIGKNNLKSFKTKNGELKTFFIYPIDYSNMRVGISTTGFSSVYHNKVQIKTLEPSKLYSVRESLNVDLPKDSVILLEKDGSNIKLTVNNKTTVYKNRLYIKGNSIDIQSIKRGSGSSTFSPSYSGVLEFSTFDNGIYVVNDVNLEDYLKKVVPSEMPLSGGVEALKCQAVAARTYAISDMINNRYASLGFYVDDSTRSQVYNNIPMQPLATEAVDATKGIIMTYEGTPIDAKYYSTSAGTGVNYSDVWFNADGTSDNRPYIANNNYLIPKIELPKNEESWLNFYKNTSIKAIDSDYPYFRWKVEYSTAGLTTALNKTLKSLYSGETSKKYLTIYQNSKQTNTLPELKELQDIKVVKRGENGIAIEISFIFSNATVNVKGDSYIRSSIKCSQEYTNEATKLTRFKGDPLTNVGSLPSSFFSCEKKDGKFTLYGGGFGHGAGMSQYGAIELSKKGIKYADILNLFYKDVKIEKVIKD